MRKIYSYLQSVLNTYARTVGLGISFLFMFTFSKLNAQVLNGDITLSTQAQVDAFNFTQVNGTITISGADITNLNGLSELTKSQNLLIVNNPALTSVIGLASLEEVDHNLTIRHNSALTNITGFSSLTTVGSLNVDALTIDDNDNLLNVDGLFNLTFATKFIISGNAKLPNLDGLSALTSVEHFFIISSNPLLTSLTGLSHLSSISSEAGNLTINNNDALTNVNGLSGLTYAAGLLISNNAALTNLDGLSHLEDIKYGGIDIENNPALTSIDGLGHVGPFGSNLKIINNALLTNVNGLSGITSLTDIDAEHPLEIKNNASLTNLDGLSSLVSISGDLIIQGNPVLTDINGLSKLILVKEAVRIKDNLALPNIDGLLKLATIHTLEITNNHVLANLDGLAALQTVVGTITITNNPALIDFCGLYNLFHTGAIGGAINIKGNGANTITITPRAPVRVNAEPGLCSAVVPELLIGSATVEGCLVPISGSHSDFPTGNVFPVGTTIITWTANDAAGNVATGSQLVIVNDNQRPVITNSPGNINVSCAADVPAPDITSVTATDNCSEVTITHVGDVKTNETCANHFTLTRTYKATDAHNNTATCSQVITVNDNVAPQISGLTVSKEILTPPNHKMQDITVNYTITDNCVSSPAITFTVTSNEPDNGTGDGDTNNDIEIIDNHHIRLRAERAANGNGRIYKILITADDGCNPITKDSIEVRVIHNINNPQSGRPFIVGSTVNFSGDFWDKVGNKHTAQWLIDNTTTKAIVTEPAGSKNGKISGSYKFTAAGVYKLQMNITDQTGLTTYTNTAGDLEAIVVIFDPNGGNTYGGGYFNSPAGALRSDPTATGKASYGFAMNYFKNSTYPKGETQFEFKVGSFEFNALNFEYLVISNSMAQFKGTGKIIGGQSGVGFIMTVVDGQLDGSGIDKIRMKIYNKNNGSIIYDNQPGASDAALPTQAVGTNSIIVISGTNASLTTANTNQKGEMETNVPDASTILGVIAFPNPTTNNFILNINASSNERITMQVIDMHGRVIETRNVNANSMIRFGDRYGAGTYFVRVMQGKEHKEIKLIKIN
jgi:hypothetical protein